MSVAEVDYWEQATYVSDGEMRAELLWALLTYGDAWWNADNARASTLHIWNHLVSRGLVQRKDDYLRAEVWFCTTPKGLDFLKEE